MLLSIQTNISNILLQEKIIKNELAELTTTVWEQKIKISHLKISQTKITKQCADTKYELTAAHPSKNNKAKYMKCRS